MKKECQGMSNGQKDRKVRVKCWIECQHLTEMECGNYNQRVGIVGERLTVAPFWLHVERPLQLFLFKASLPGLLVFPL